MNWLLFTNPALLGGLTLLAVPILIHLLLRIKKKRLRFSTLQFFRRQDEQATRRRKLRNWLLLATRVLLFFVIVLAFARPYLAPDTPAAKATPQQQLVLVLDRSASMAVGDPEGLRWERAKSAVQNRVAQLRPDDRAALIGCTAHPETLSDPTTTPDLLKVLDTLELTHGAADLGKGLEQAARLLANSSPLLSNTICVVSDLQRASCPNLGSYPIPSEATLEVLPTGDLFAPNVAVTEFLLNPTEDSKPSATIVNFSEEDLAGFNLQLWVDGQEVSSTPLHLAMGASTNVPLLLPAPGQGWHSGQVRLQSRDAQAVDDVRYQTFYVPPPVRALVVEPRQVPRLFQEESFFAISALDPMFGLTNANPSPFSLEKTTPADLIRRLQLHNSPSPYDVVLLPGLKSITAGLAEELTQFVGAGGGLLLFLNDNLSVNRYNTEFANLLPVVLEQVETASDLDWRLWEHDETSPVFAPFTAPNSGNLALPKFTRRVVLSPIEQATVLARFQDGIPLIIDRPLGGGRVLLVNTSADSAWSDWPKHKTFVPWIHSLVRYLANRTTSEPAAAQHNLLAGAEIELDLGADFKNHSFTLLRPDGIEMACAADDQGWLQDLDLPLSGVYSLRTSEGKEIRRWAVNVPVAESDLVAMPASEFEGQIARSEPSRSLALGLFGSGSDRHELWRLLLLAGLVLLLLELLLANRTLT